jgi:hypothetical protein
MMSSYLFPYSILFNNVQRKEYNVFTHTCVVALYKNMFFIIILLVLYPRYERSMRELCCCYSAYCVCVLMARSPVLCSPLPAIKLQGHTSTWPQMRNHVCIVQGPSRSNAGVFARISTSCFLLKTYLNCNILQSSKEMQQMSFKAELRFSPFWVCKVMFFLVERYILMC